MTTVTKKSDAPIAVIPATLTDDQKKLLPLIAATIDQASSATAARDAAATSINDMLHAVRLQFPNAKLAAEFVAAVCAQKMEEWRKSPAARNNDPAFTDEQRQSAFERDCFYGVEAIRQAVNRHKDYQHEGAALSFKFNKARHAKIVAGEAHVEATVTQSDRKVKSTGGTAATTPAVEPTPKTFSDIAEFTNAGIAQFTLYPLLGSLLVRAGLQQPVAATFCAVIEAAQESGKAITMSELIERAKGLASKAAQAKAAEADKNGNKRTA